MPDSRQSLHSKDKKNMNNSFFPSKRPIILEQMTVRRINLYAVCVFAVFPAIMLWKFIAGHDKDRTDLSITCFIMAVAWGIGVFIGVALSAIVKKARLEPYFYLAGHLAVIATITAIIASTIFAQHRRYRQSNSQQNADLVNLEKRPYEPVPIDFVRTAFLKLEVNSSNRDSFYLEGYSSRWKEIVNKTAPDTIYYVYFAYLKDKKLLFAKVSVLRDFAFIDWMDRVDGSEQKDPTTKPGPWARRANRTDVEQQLKDLPDSTRDKVLDILSK